MSWINYISKRRNHSETEQRFTAKTLYFYVVLMKLKNKFFVNLCQRHEIFQYRRFWLIKQNKTIYWKFCYVIAKF